MRQFVPVGLAASCRLIVSATTGKATIYADTEAFASLISGSNKTYTGAFDIASKGYSFATETVTKATVWFGLSDDRRLDSLQWVKFELGPQLDTLGAYEVDLLDAYSGQV